MASGDNFSDIAFCLQKAKIQYKSARNIQQFKYIDVLFHFKMLIKLWQKITPYKPVKIISCEESNFPQQIQNIG